MDPIQVGTVVGLSVVIPAGLAARWLSRRTWRVVGFFLGWAIGIIAAIVLAFGVPWVIEDIPAGQWIYGVMRSGIILGAVGALAGVRRRAANPA
jgi:asparagine N-glycosylation enzyme membrane subunit Stt3